MELTQVFNDALQLSDTERATLVGLLIESLETSESGDTDVEAVWAAEAERRWQEIESGAVKTIPWDEVSKASPRGMTKVAFHPEAEAELENART